MDKISNLYESLKTLIQFDSANKISKISSIDDVLNKWNSYKDKWKNGVEFCKLFDSKFYLTSVGADLLGSQSPLEHYLSIGWRKFNPNRLFDTPYYLAKYGNFLKGENPLTEYSRTFLSGAIAHRNPSPYFDSEFYLSRNIDINKNKLDPLTHFITNGHSENRPFHPFIDLNYIENQLIQIGRHPQIKTKLDLINYIIDFNILLYIDPSVLFSNKIYMESKPKNSPLILNPIYDYHFQDDPSTMGSPIGLFDTLYYTNQNPEIDFCRTNPFSHYICFASNDAETSPLISWKEYLKLNSDLHKSNIKPLIHFIHHGYNERRFVSSKHRLSFIEKISIQKDKTSTPREVATLNFRSANKNIDTFLPISIDTVRNSKTDILTIDFWDTLVFRTSPHWTPKIESASLLAKIFTSNDHFHSSNYSVLILILQNLKINNTDIRNILTSICIQKNISALEIYKTRILIEADLHKDNVEYKFDDVLTKLLDSFFQNIPLKHKKKLFNKIISECLLIELEYEIKHTKLNSELYKLICDLTETKINIAIISDYYHDSTYIRQVLQGNLPTNSIIPLQVKIISSSEVGSSKFNNGELFLYFLRNKHNNSNVTPYWIHIGDSYYSDIIPAHKIGIDTVHLLTNKGSKVFDLPEPSSTSVDNYRVNVGSQLLKNINEFTTHPNFKPNHTINSIRSELINQAGIKNAIFSVSLVIHAINKAYTYGEKIVYYASREGAFLSKIHQKIRTTLPGHLQNIYPQHLEISRRSLFSPLFYCNEDFSFKIFTSQYKDASISTYIKALIPEIYINEIGLNLNLFEHTFINDLTSREVFNILGESAYLSLKSWGKNQFNLIMHYLKTCGFDSSRKNAILCDIGWRGTMQDMLSALHTNINTHGVYLGLFPYVLEQPINTIKEGLIFDANNMDEYLYVNPPAALERPWTPNIGSVCMYAIDKSKKVIPILDESDCTERSDIDIKTYQDASIDASIVIGSELHKFNLQFDDLRKILQQEFKNYYLNPDLGTSELWFSSLHDDTFGLGTDPYKKKLPNPVELSSSNHNFLFHKSSQESNWQNGFIKWTDAIWFNTMCGN